MEEKTQNAVTLSKSISYKKHAKKGVYTTKGEGNYISGVIFIYVRCSISKFMCSKRNIHTFWHCCCS